MQFDKNSLRNANVYTAIALSFLFMLLSGLIPNNPMIFSIKNQALRYLITSIFLLGAGSSLVFILTRVIKRRE